MYFKTIELDPNSFVEISSRITAQGDKLQLSLRGEKDQGQITIASALLEKSDVELLMNSLQEWLQKGN